MSDSILNDVKQALGLDPNYTPFDPEIIMNINSVLTVVNDLGLGPDEVVVIEGADDGWALLNLPNNQLSMVKTYVYMKVRLAFDPPTMGFHIDALKSQIEQQEWRLRERQEATIDVEDSAWKEPVL